MSPSITPGLLHYEPENRWWDWILAHPSLIYWVTPTQSLAFAGAYLPPSGQTSFACASGPRASRLLETVLVPAGTRTFHDLLAGYSPWNNLCGFFSNGPVYAFDAYYYVSPTGPPWIPPIAEFTGYPVSGVAPLLVLFTDESTNTPGAWLWDFGDGFFSIEQNPFHTYLTPGVYTVALRVNNTGGTDLKVKVGYITVTAPPPHYSPLWSMIIGPL